MAPDLEKYSPPTLPGMLELCASIMVSLSFTSVHLAYFGAPSVPHLLLLVRPGVGAEGKEKTPRTLNLSGGKAGLSTEVLSAF